MINSWLATVIRRLKRVASVNDIRGTQIEINPRGVEEFTQEVLNWGEDQKREDT